MCDGERLRLLEADNVRLRGEVVRGVAFSQETSNYLIKEREARDRAEAERDRYHDLLDKRTVERQETEAREKVLREVLVPHAMMAVRYVGGNDYEVECWCGWKERRTGSDSEALWRRKAWAEHVAERALLSSSPASTEGPYECAVCGTAWNGEGARDMFDEHRVRLGHNHGGHAPTSEGETK